MLEANQINGSDHHQHVVAHNYTSTWIPLIWKFEFYPPLSRQIAVNLSFSPFLFYYFNPFKISKGLQNDCLSSLSLSHLILFELLSFRPNLSISPPKP